MGALVGAAELAVPYKLLGSDAYMALVCGRLVAQHGLPHHDTLVAGTAGKAWVDQQWLGQLALWGVERIGGLWGLVAFHALLVGAAAAIGARFAEKRGAGANALLLGAIGMMLVDSSYVILRAQTFSMVAFAALLVILREDLEAPSRRIHLVWPILALWANVHAAVVIGAGLVVLRAAFDFAQKRVVRGVGLCAGAAVAPFATPYALEMPAYFRNYAAHLDAKHEFPVIEWLPPKDDLATFAIVAIVVALIFVPWIRRREKPPAFESIVLAVCAVAGMRAARHMVWLGIAVATYAPILIARIPAVRERELHVVAWVVRLAPIMLLAGFVRLALLPRTYLERMYPIDALEPLRQTLAAHPKDHVIASDVLADWLLWRAPELEGRVELDSRLELLDRDQARDFGRFLFARAGYETLFPDARLALVSKKDHGALAAGLRARAGSTIVWEGPDALLVWR